MLVKLTAAMTTLARMLRTIAVAFKPVKAKKKYSPADEQEMILKGYMCFLDPRKRAQGIIKIMHDNGVAIKILTGDNELSQRKSAPNWHARVRHETWL